MHREFKQCLVSILAIGAFFIIVASTYFGFYFITDAGTPKTFIQDKDRSSQSGRMSQGGATIQLDLLKTHSKETAKTSTSYYQAKNDTTIYRKDTSPEETVRLPFLKNYRNPCWREFDTDKNNTRILCLPYFYLVGAPKCGTTDLYRRLRKHPLISKKVNKEQHWLTRNRFKQAWKLTLSSYLKYFEEAVKKDISKTERNNYHPMVFGDCSASVFWDNRRLLRQYRFRRMTSPPYTNADIIHNLIPGAKILIILRNPITRLYSEYLYFKEHDKSAERFHEDVVFSIQTYNRCSRIHNPHFCVYFPTAPLRLHIGMYHIYIEDYLRVFGKDQIKILKLEDYSQHMEDSLNGIFTFLGIGKPSKKAMTQICEHNRTKTRTKEDEKVGDILPSTWQLLAEFYKPYNERLVQLLGNKFKYD